MSLFEIQATHYYLNENDEPKLRIMRAIDPDTGDKTFWQAHMKDDKWKKGGTKEPFAPYLYKNWRTNSDVLFHVEGEKCADRVMKEGLNATTSPGGAKAWRKNLATFYQDRDVIILPDNDLPGIEYARLVAKDIHRFAKSVKVLNLENLTTGEDVFDWFEKGNTKDDLLRLGQEAQPLNGTEDAESEKPGSDTSDQEPVDQQTASLLSRYLTSGDYFGFFEDRLRGPKRDIVSGDLMAFVGGLWQPARSRLDILASYAFDSAMFKKSQLKEHLARFEESKEPELLVDLPVWDGVDRIKQIAQCVHLDNCNREHFYELLCDWGAKLFLRIYNPKVQNRIIVLQGPQGMGKDTLIDEMLGGFGQFAASIPITNDERETQAAVGSLIVARIPEFDRTARTEISTLKDLITREHTFIRLPYDRAAKIRPVRCSFIASANIADLLRDHTGNRRFIIFNISKIDWEYPKGQSLQILAQFKHLAKCGFQPSAEAEDEMTKFIVSQTPDNPEDAILESFDARIAALEGGTIRREFTRTEILPLIVDLTKSFGVRINAVFQMLKVNGRSKRTNSGMLYFRRVE
jgi:hypothetical protein